MNSETLIKEAEALRAAAHALGDVLYEKCLAYGGAHNRQAGLWEVMLRRYYDATSGEYRVPRALMLYHVPRLTRALDRMLRIVNHPDADPAGEDPWKDLAGDALAGVVMPKPCPEHGCELADGHVGPHRRFDAAGLRSWIGTVVPSKPRPGEGGTLCGTHFHLTNHTPELRVCARRMGHEGPHVDERGLADPAFMERVLGGMERPRGFVPEEEEKAPECGAQFQTLVGTRECALATGHIGGHRCAGGLEESGRA